MNFTPKDRKLGHAEMEKSPKFTAAQRVRRALMVRRPRVLEISLTPREAVFRVAALAEKAMQKMRDFRIEPEGNLFCALVLTHERDGVLTGKTVRIPAPLGPKEMAAVIAELDRLKNARPVGSIFQVMDHEATPAGSRIWAYQFILSKEATQILEMAVEAQKNARPN